MSISIKNLTLLLVILGTFISVSADAQDYGIPERTALRIGAQIPQTPSELSVAFAKGATAKSCTTGKKTSCTCLRYKNIRVRKWTPNQMYGVSYTDKNATFFIEKFDPKLNHYSGFWKVSDTGWRADLLASSLEEIRFGKVSKPDSCSSVPKFQEEASAEKAIWSNINQRWDLKGFQRKHSIARRDFSEEQESGILAPTLFIGEDQYEIQGGYYVPVLRSQVLANISNTRVGAGLGLLTRRPFLDELSQLEVGGRLEFESKKFIPFLNGNVFLGSKRLHISGRFDVDKGLPSRPLIGRRLFQNAQRNRIGILLSGDGHHLRFAGIQRNTGSEKREVSGEYTSRFLLQGTALDINLRYQATDLESDAPLQSTTLSLRLNHRFGDAGLYLKPSIQLTNNFSTIPINKGFDASTTGFFLGQVSSGMRLIGRFSDLSHIIDLQLLGGRDLFGFQQRSIRDGGSPFTFVRKPGLTYAWAGIENSILSEVWNAEIPVGVLVDNIDETWTAIPILSFKVSTEGLRMDIQTMCSDSCAELRFHASTNVDLPEYKWGQQRLRLSLYYGFSDYTAADLMRVQIRESNYQMFRFQPLPGVGNAFFHAAHFKVGFQNYSFGIEGYASDAFEGLLATMRLKERLGWSVDSRMGWSSQFGFSAQVGLSTNSRFFSH